MKIDEAQGVLGDHTIYHDVHQYVIMYALVATTNAYMIDTFVVAVVCTRDLCMASWEKIFSATAYMRFELPASTLPSLSTATARRCLRQSAITQYDTARELINLVCVN